MNVEDDTMHLFFLNARLNDEKLLLDSKTSLIRFDLI